jgi:hypothetical protein
MLPRNKTTRQRIIDFNDDSEAQADGGPRHCSAAMQMGEYCNEDRTGEYPRRVNGASVISGACCAVSGACNMAQITQVDES